MHTTKRSKAIGLDIGQTSTKLVCLSRSGRKASVKRAEIFRLRDEGIVGDDEAEQFQAIGAWLKELKLQDKRVVLGLPQYMATTQLSDFAKGAKGSELEKMVGYETMQLAGISDDAFIHDYTVMPAGNGRQNPVLIGICREANVDDYASRAVDVSIQLEDVAMNGLALANAFFMLQPKAGKEAGVQLLMDMGTETTTVVVVSGGQVLYIGAMMFGGTNITQDLARQLDIAFDEAERRKVSGEIDWASLNLEAMSSEKKSESLLSLAGIDEAPSPEARPQEDDQDVNDDAVARMEALLNGELGDDGPGKLALPSIDQSEDGFASDDEAVVSSSNGLKLPGVSLLKLDDGAAAPKSDSGLELPAAPVEDVTSPGPSSAPVLSGLACFQGMLRELGNCLEHWRSSEQDALASQSLSKIWICGGCASLEMVASYLSVNQNCDVEILGPQLSKKGPVEPEYTIAYGLALQGLGLAELPVSLSPSALAWMHKKESRVKYLFLAFLLLFGCVFGWGYYQYQSMTAGIALMDEETDELRRNVQKLSKLDGMKKEYSESLLQVLPVVASSSRTQVFMAALTKLQAAVKGKPVADSNSWCVYVADSASFLEYNETKDKVEVVQAQPIGLGRRRAMRVETTDAVVDEVTQKWNDTLEAEAKSHDVIGVVPLDCLYVVGIIMSKNDNHNVIEREIMLRLENEGVVDGRPETSFFSEVQVMNEEERTKVGVRALGDWEKCFANMRTSEAFKHYDHKAFFLRLRLRDKVVDPPAQNPLVEVKKGKKKKK